MLVVANLSRFAQCAELDLSQVPAAWCRGSSSARPSFRPSRPAVLSFAGAARVLLVRAAAQGSARGDAADPYRRAAHHRGAILGRRLLRRGAGHLNRMLPYFLRDGAGSAAGTGPSGWRRSTRSSLSRSRGRTCCWSGWSTPRASRSSTRCRFRWPPERGRRFGVGAGPPAGARRHHRRALQRARNREFAMNCWPAFCGAAASRASAASGGVAHPRFPRASGATTVRRWNPSLSRVRPGQHHALLWRPVRAEVLSQSGGGSASGTGDRRVADAGRLSQRGAAGGHAGVPRRDGEPMVAGAAPRLCAAGHRSLAVHARPPGPVLRTRAGARTTRGPTTAHAERTWRSELIGSYLETVRLLGTRTGELHAALASRPEDPVFAPEPSPISTATASITACWRAWAAPWTSCAAQSATVCPKRCRRTPRRCSIGKPAIRDQLRFLRDQRIDASRIRIHGDYHLAQALYTGKDFVLIDFEGDLARPLSERRIKRSPLRGCRGHAGFLLSCLSRRAVRRGARRDSRTRIR